ncbi:MAG: hypothetical protein WD599_06065 [Balneolaceae bacterium]
MASFELNERNYRRIALINWVISLPLLLIFSWPYYFVCQVYNIDPIVSYPGSLLFALPFMITLLHGHVTMALGSLHRHHYYDWLNEKPLTYGLLFHKTLISTRFRLALFVVSLIIFFFGLFFSY